MYADPVRPIPQVLADLRIGIVRYAPFRREAVLVIEPVGMDDVSLRDMVQPAIRGMVRVLAVADRGPVAQGDGEGVSQLLELRMRPMVSEDTAEGGPSATVSLPAAADESLRAPCTGLYKASLEALFAGDQPVLAVDGALAMDKDIMRAVLGLTRRNPARILVCGESAAVDAPEVSVLRPGPALLGRIAARSLAVLVPAAGGSQALSMPEVLGLGGRCVAVGKTLQVHDLGELAALPSGTTEPLFAPDYAAFWDQVLTAAPSAPVAAVPERPRIALVTPFVPQKGGPPQSSLNFALALTEIAQLDIWTDSNMLPAHRARMNAVYRLDATFEADRYDGIVYVLGNHPMYLKIFDMMREHGGTLILHDAHMVDFLSQRYGRKRLSAILSQEHGAPIDASDPGKVIGKLIEYGRPFLREIVRHANPTIVHSPTSAAVLHNLYGIDVNYFPLGMSYPFEPSELTPEARLQAKLALGIIPSRPCIASFGEVHMMKGAKQCLFVMKELLDWGIDFQFLFVGPVDKSLDNELRERIEQYGLQDHVVIKGAVSDADYIQHLKAVDIVLQIRQIPFGQVSGALLDAVSAGMHGVASENLARSIEAPPLVRRVNDKASPTIYAEQLAEMIAARSYEDRPGPGWEDFTVKHDFGRYARNLLSMLFGKRD
ncbi:glycosyltransferase [Sphingomonas sp. H39-1-10]|nr:glycosyltransferase [Sphingomonas pollutisoli]